MASSPAHSLRPELPIGRNLLVAELIKVVNGMFPESTFKVSP